MYWLVWVFFPWHLVNTKTGEVHTSTSSLVTGHLSLYEVPHLHQSWVLSPAAKENCSSSINFKRSWKHGASTWRPGCSYPMHICRLGNFGQSAWLFFFDHPYVISCKWWNCAVRERCHCTNWHSFVQEQPREETPAFHHSHLNAICGGFRTTDSLWFLREFLCARTWCLKHCP